MKERLYELDKALRDVCMKEYIANRNEAINELLAYGFVECEHIRTANGAIDKYKATEKGREFYRNRGFNGDLDRKKKKQKEATMNTIYQIFVIVSVVLSLISLLHSYKVL